MYMHIYTYLWFINQLITVRAPPCGFTCHAACQSGQDVESNSRLGHRQDQGLRNLRVPVSAGLKGWK